MLKKTLCALLVLSLLTLSVSAQPEKYAVSARGSVVMDASSGRTLFEYNAHNKLAMASTTKIMTALLALEQEGIDEYFTVDANAIKVEGTSMGLREGDSVSLRALASGMLLPSGNDAANAAAVRIAGSIPEFANLMNGRAGEIGMLNSSFVTPSGLDADGHYSTAYDMALLAREALNNPDFSQICSSRSVVVEYGNPPYRRTLSNHNRLLSLYDGAIGVKTGFTDEAGRCLVSAAQRDGVTLICVTLGASDDWNLHRNLYDRYFNDISLIGLTDLAGELEFDVAGGAQPKVKAEFVAEPTAALLEGEREEVRASVQARPFLYAPVSKGDVIGSVRFYLRSEKLCEADIIAAQDVPALHPPKASLFSGLGRLVDGLKGLLGID